MGMRVVTEPYGHSIPHDIKHSRLYDFFELFIVITLGISLALIFFNAPRWTRVFGETGFGVFLLWTLVFKREPSRRLPGYLVLMAVTFILSYVVNVFLSPDPAWEHTNIRKYIYVLIAGLLFAQPIRHSYRKFMILILFVSAAIAGAAGIMQYFGLISQQWPRPHGFSQHPIVYAALLALVCGSAVIMLFWGKSFFCQSTMSRIFLLGTGSLTFGGILVSGSRGVWIALAVSCFVTLFIYDHRKAIIFLFSASAVCVLVVMFSSALRDRATSIVTSFYTEDEKGSTGTRIELWKGSLLIFKQHPLLGVGTGNYQFSIEELVREKKMKEPLVEMHAHNIFFQALATRGLIGLAVTVGFIVALMKWGTKEIHNSRQIGGYIIVLCTVLTIIGGLTENNIEYTRYLAAFCFTIGLIGPYVDQAS